MVEREAQLASERAKIAAVIYNRLKAGMALGIDATIRYALNDWTRPLKASELNADGPYNTRKRKGLPPTPIGNPGLASIRAAAAPANVDYLYYVVKPGDLRQARVLVHERAVPARQPALQPGAQRGRRQVADDLLMADPAGAGRYGVLGWPVGHSRSPAMMQAAGLTRYQRLPVAPPVFDDTVRALAGAGFRGANVTIPHKQAALALATSASDAAREIGAANTLSFGEDGSIAAENTDAPGLMAALGHAPASALVLGAGGSARAVVWALTRAGADVSIWNRTAERARGLGARVVARPVAAEVLVNCTSVGLDHTSTFFKERTPGRRCAQRLRNRGRPGLQSRRYSAHCKRPRGEIVNVVDGLEILVRQGALSFSLWTGLPAPLDTMRAAVRTPQPEVDVARSDSP